MAATTGEAKVRLEVFLAPRTQRAIEAYAVRSDGGFRTCSQAAAHLLELKLGEVLDGAAEGVVAPHLQAALREAVTSQMVAIRAEMEAAAREIAASAARAVREAAAREMEEVVRRYTKQQGNRLAPLMVKAGKDAYVAAEMTRALLLYDLESPERVEAYWREAQIAAGRHYAKKLAEDAE